MEIRIWMLWDIHLQGMYSFLRHRKKNISSLIGQDPVLHVIWKKRMGTENILG